MIVVAEIIESYRQKILVKIPDNTPNAEEKVRGYLEDKYRQGDINFDVSKADYVDCSGEVSISYADDEKKYGEPDFILNEKGVENEC